MKKRTKKEMIYEQLKEEIYRGDYNLNEKIIIDSLAKRFNSSVIPVREALNLLNADGLVDMEPHIGAVVKPLSKKDLRNIFELRVELEGLATRLAVHHLKDEDYDYLRMILDASIAAFKRRETERFEDLNIKFHNAIYEKSDNDLLVKTIGDLWKNTKRYPSLFERNDAYIQRSIQEHEEIFEAIKEQNSRLAEDLMIQHKVRAGEEVLSITQREFYNNLSEELT